MLPYSSLRITYNSKIFCLKIYMLSKLLLSLNVGQNLGHNTYLLMHETKE